VDGLRRFLGNPIGWLVFSVAEVVVVMGLVVFVVPRDLPTWANVAILIALIVGLFAVNWWLRERLGLQTRDAPPGGRRPR
jgi:uncharacterized membrane-anchored protein